MMDSTNASTSADSTRRDATLRPARFATQDTDMVPGREPRRLKQDPFGSITVSTAATGELVVQRDVASARWWARWLARRLAAREARALQRATDIDGVPRLLSFTDDMVTRTWLQGKPMFQARPRTRVYYRDALRLLRRLHRRGIAHNDLAKEPNWLCRPDGSPAVIDFQLAIVSPKRGPLFRLLAREDIRHLLKHKRTYCVDHLTDRQRRLLERPGWPSRWSKRLLKPLYLTVTRSLLGWEDREGAGDRRKL